MVLLAWDFGMEKIRQMHAVKLQESLQKYGAYKIKRAQIYLEKISRHFALA